MNIVVATSKQEIDDALFVRQEVFVHEQKVPIEVELDEFDQDAIHFVGYDDKKPIVSGRIRLFHDAGKLERIARIKTLS